LVARLLPIPAMVIALIIGIAINPLARHATFQAGIALCVTTILRGAVALLGLRIALEEIVDLGFTTVAIVIVSMVVTIIGGLLIARMFGRNAGYGALIGAGTAVCGASATLATSTVIPSYPNKQADVAFVVVAVNALSTLAMLLYPSICAWFGFDAQTTGILLGATIHDVAQVVGAGYSVSEAAGNTAVLVKLFRVFLLLPVVAGIALWFGRSRSIPGAASAPLPIFAFVFLGLSLLNSSVQFYPALLPFYTPVRSLLVDVSNAGLLLAIAALGLGTSLSAIRALGWRHMVTALGTTIVILLVVIAGLLAAKASFQ
jgi:uncharacterized integral membrane protein (TIGR00698 family)